MSALKSPVKIIGLLLTLCILAACTAVPATSEPASIDTPAVSVPEVTPPQPPIKPNLMTFIRNIQVTPADGFRIGGFARVGYVPATDRLVVVFGTSLEAPVGECTSSAHAYREFTLDMEPTGRSGVLNCGGGDSAGLMVDNFYYDVSMDEAGWRIFKYDMQTWQPLADIVFPLDSPVEQNGDPMLEFVGGQIDISSGYTPSGDPPPPDEGGATHHQFFSPDLVFLGKRILSDIPHNWGSSMILLDGIYYFVTSSAFTGDVIVMEYDQDWNYLGVKTLIEQAHWPTGLAFDGIRFYIAYLDTSLRTDLGFFPFYPNVHLAAFDRAWNLIEDVAVTNYSTMDGQFTGRPWVLLHGNKLYVAYDDVPLPEDLEKIQAFVSIYELNPAP